MDPTPPDHASLTTTGPDPVNAAPHGPRERAEAGEHGLPVDADPVEVAEQEPDLDPADVVRHDDASDRHGSGAGSEAGSDTGPGPADRRDEDPIAAPAPPGTDPPRSEHAELGDTAYGVGVE